MNNTSYMTKTTLSQTEWTDVCINGYLNGWIVKNNVQH